jgi:hypothetical protein
MIDKLSMLCMREIEELRGTLRRDGGGFSGGLWGGEGGGVYTLSLPSPKTTFSSFLH